MHAKLQVLQVSAVIAVGLVEGFSHVNWKMFFQLIWWWTVGFLVVVLSTAALVAQGEPHCSICLQRQLHGMWVLDLTLSCLRCIALVASCPMLTICLGIGACVKLFPSRTFCLSIWVHSRADSPANTCPPAMTVQ